MAKINLIIFDGDTRYADNLAYYVTENYRHRFNVATFSKADAFVGYVQQKDAQADILLVNANEAGEWLAKLESGLVILLCEGGARREGFDGVDRYCGADRLVADILTIYDKRGRQPSATGNARAGRDNRIIALFSAEGGAGRTSVAISLCAHFAKLRLDALYLGMGYMDAAEFAFGGGSSRNGGVSELIYTMKTRPERLGIKLEALRKCAPGPGFYYYDPPAYPMDLDEMLPADIEMLVAKLRGSGIYDRIVIDTNSGLSMRNKTLMELADHIFIVAQAAGAGRKKLELFKAQIDKYYADRAGELYKRAQIIINNAGNNDNMGGGRYTAAAQPAERVPDGCAGHAAANAATAAVAAEISALFSAKASVIPHCEAVCGEYDPAALSSVSNGFGEAAADIAHRI